jgi:type IV secretion system protein VirB4
MCPTQLHFPNPRGSRADYVDGLKLTEGQWGALSVLQKGEGLFLLIQGEESVVAQLPLRGLDQYIGVLSAREKDLRESDERLAEPILMEAAE